MDWTGWSEAYCTTGRHVVEGTGTGMKEVVWQEKCASCGAAVEGQARKKAERLALQEQYMSGYMRGVSEERVVETPAIKPNKA